VTNTASCLLRIRINEETMSKSNLSVGTNIWVGTINAAWREGTRHALDAWREVGVKLLAAKDALPHGDFENMIKSQLDFTPQTARKLMIVASDTRVLNRAPERGLPDHWTTYYELTKLSDDELDQAFASGVIGPEMRRSDVPKKRKESPQGDDAVSAGGDSDDLAHPTAEVSPPQDDSEGGDSVVVTEPIHESSRAREAVPDAPRGNTAPARETIPAAPWPASAKPGKVAYYVEADNPASVLANGLSMMMSASHELSTRDAALKFPKDMPLLSEELDVFVDYMIEFRDRYRARYGNGNDAALAAE
jgi:hypothetical protein